MAENDPEEQQKRVRSTNSVTKRQRCLVHKYRNVMSAIPKREQQEMSTELKGIWQQEKKEEALLKPDCCRMNRLN